MSAAAGMHVLIDLSSERLTPERWTLLFGRLAAGDNLAGLSGDVTCITPSEAPMPVEPALTRWRWPRADAADATAECLMRAGRAGAHLLVVIGAVTGCTEAAVSLVDSFDEDPMFGAAHPRFASEGGGDILPVQGSGGHHTVRAALPSLPPSYLLPDYLTSCFVLRRDLLANLDPVVADASSPIDVLYEYLRRARRVGYRSVVRNSVVVALPRRGDAPSAELADTPRRTHWDSDTARQRFRRLDAFDREQRLSALHRRPARLLFDARNLGAAVNGTTKAVLGMADALSAADDARWDVTLVASKEGAEAHAMETRFPRWSIAHELPETPFAAAFRPSQPWDLAELIELHRLAAVNLYLMLDTIAWDVVYTAPRRLDATWRFAARYADGLLFISEFSRQRFLARFPAHADVLTGVCHLSLDPADYVDPAAAAAPPQPDRPWFVVGNEYDHKHLRPTLALLARAFPTTRLTALGVSAAGSQLAGIVSGHATESDVQRLYAGAALMIFPSLYEGFGLPVVNALAYGTTVVARDSALLREIAESYQGPGRLIPYSTPDELVERLSRLRHDLPVPELPLGRTGAAISGWTKSAGIIHDALERLTAPRGIRRELDRHEAVCLLDTWSDSGKAPG